MIKREKYLAKIRGFYESDLIKVITGIRRSGKSVLLTQIMGELMEKGVAKDHLIYLNFEDLANSELLEAKKLNREVVKRITDDKRYYLFFDEIQNVHDFERVINSLRVRKKISIFITGSNSKLLAGELATLLSGRYVSFMLMPFSFSEAFTYAGYKESEKQVAFNKYFTWGGMPQLYHLNSRAEYKIYLEDLYHSIILKDVVARYKIKDLDLLTRIIQFIIENIGGIFSANSINKFLKSESISVSPPTIYNYLDAISSSLIINRVNRYDIRGKRVIQFYDKYYLADIGFTNLKKSSVEPNNSGKLENLVYNELLYRGYKVYIGEVNGQEIDFLADGDDGLFYLQVTESLVDPQVVKREFGALERIEDNFPKLILSLDPLDHSRRGIKHRNLIEWLLESKVN